MVERYRTKYQTRNALSSLCFYTTRPGGSWRCSRESKCYPRRVSGACPARVRRVSHDSPVNLRVLTVSDGANAASPTRFGREPIHVAAIDGVLHLHDHVLAAE